MTSSDYFPPAAATGDDAREAHRVPAASAPPPGLMLGKAIELRAGRMSSLTALLLGVITLTVAVALWFGHFARSESMRGVISTVGGFARIEAPRAGVVKEILVHQGDAVEVGSPIAVLRLNQTTSGGETPAAVEIRALGQQRLNHEAEIRRADALIAQVRRETEVSGGDDDTFAKALAEQERTVAAALAHEQATVTKLAGLVKSGYATNDMLDQHRRVQIQYERDLADVRLKAVETQRQLSARRRELDATLADRTAARANAENQISAIDSRMVQLRAEGTVEIVAQSAGRVLTIAAKPGDGVDDGQLIAAIGDSDDAPVIVLDAPAGAIGLAKVGQRVALKYDAFPYKTFGVFWGTVTSISSSAVKPAVSTASGAAAAAAANSATAANAASATTPSQSVYRVEVRPDRATVNAYGEEQKIAIGSTLTAEIVVERRRLIDWVIDPIRAMQGRT